MTKALYSRLSEETDGQGTIRQDEDTRSLARIRGYDDVREYCDPDHSAYKRDVIRPEFERMLIDLANGTIDGVIVYHLDRLARQPMDLERLILIYEQNKSLTFDTCTGEIDLSTTSGLMMARILVTMANGSSADTGRRVARKHVQRAEQGKPAGSRYRTFGYNPDWTINRSEAKEIRSAADRIIAGIPMAHIIKEWNERGITTTAGNPWRTGGSSFRDMITHPRYIGKRVFKGEIMGKATWPAILDEETHNALVATIAGRNRRTRTSTQRYLLSGIIRCSVCGSRMGGGWDNRINRHNYMCKCGTSAHGPEMDTLVTELLLAYLSNSTITREVVPFDGDEEIAACDARISELMAEYNAGRLSGARTFPAVEENETRIAELKAERSTWQREQARIKGTPVNPVADWPTYTLDQQRNVIALNIQAVVIRPSRRGHFDRDRASVVWQED